MQTKILTSLPCIFFSSMVLGVVSHVETPISYTRHEIEAFGAKELVVSISSEVKTDDGTDFEYDASLRPDPKLPHRFIGDCGASLEESLGLRPKTVVASKEITIKGFHAVIIIPSECKVKVVSPTP